MAHGDGEPYLADMVAATAAAVHGVLGIEPTWETTHGHASPAARLAPGRGRRPLQGPATSRGHRKRNAQIEPLEQVLGLPLLWVMDFNLRRTAYAQAQTTNVAFLGHYGDRITLAEGAASGTYQSPAHDWGVPASLQELTVAAELNGAEVTVSIETSDDGFKTVTSGKQDVGAGRCELVRLEGRTRTRGSRAFRNAPSDRGGGLAGDRRLPRHRRRGTKSNSEGDLSSGPERRAFLLLVFAVRCKQDRMSG